jgi:hypothetical protein
MAPHTPGAGRPMPAGLEKRLICVRSFEKGHTKQMAQAPKNQADDQLYAGRPLGLEKLF